MQLLRDRVLRETYMCSKVCGMISRGELRENHPQQRKSGQWKNDVRDNFIVTVISNEDFDPIKICEQLTDEGVVLWLIDGLQRSTTIADFKAGKFALGKNIEPAFIEYQTTERTKDGKMVNKNVSYDLRGKNYAELPEKLKEEFDNCPVMVVKHLDCSDTEIGRHIVRYNSGSKMVTAQKIVTYMPEKAEGIKKLSNHPFFNDCANYSETSDKNGNTDKVVCESVMFMNIFDKWSRDAKKIGKLIEENITVEMLDKFSNQLDRLLKIITPEMGELFSSKNALLWFKLFDKFTTLGLDDNKFVSFLEEFNELKKVKFEVSKTYKLNKGSENEIDTNVVSFAELNANSSSKDRGLLTDKYYILEKLMDEFLHTEETSVDEENDYVEIIQEESDEVVSDEQFIADCVKMDVAEIQEDMDFYEQSLDDLLEVVENEDSKLLNEENRPSLLAMIVYSYKEDVDLEDWMKEYSENNNTYFIDKRKNFLHMLSNLKNFLGNKENNEVGGDAA